MIERYLQAVATSEAGDEDPAGTRQRLKDRFPPGATRRMTQLGMLVGSVLAEVPPRPDDAVVYASEFGESRALEAYLESFPAASPTLFQTSIHPSAVQQVLIGRQQAVGEFFPLTGRTQLVAQAVQTALLAEAPRVLLCGGEERGTWLLAHGAASDRGFAFALALAREPAGALGRIGLEPANGGGAVELRLPGFFAALATRAPLDTVTPSGHRLWLRWEP